MDYDELLKVFSQFGLAILVGVLIGLERELRGSSGSSLGLRDFVFLALLGALTTFLAQSLNSVFIVGLGFAGLLTFVLSAYWADRAHGSGITTEIAALITFFLGVLILLGHQELAIALTIITLGVLFPKATIKELTAKVSGQELRAVVLFLTISFIILPVLPNQTLDHFATTEVGSVEMLDPVTRKVRITPSEAPPAQGAHLDVFGKGWQYIGGIRVIKSGSGEVIGEYEGAAFDRLEAGQMVRARLSQLEPLYVVLAAINPYRIWLIVVLVSFVSFLGYVLIKTIGSRSGIGLTGLIGGLVSSTVTTLSFARRSQENATATPLFAAAVILASSIMFPRLILEIGVFNATLMHHIALPLAAMGVTGMIMAAITFRNFRSKVSVDGGALVFDNPFSLKSAVTFAAVFALILVATRLATTYLGNAWLPVVAIVSGLTDADAIAFSISNLQRNGLVDLDWASFNLVLGALANTFMKLALVYTLGSRALFRQLFLSFTVIGVVGVISMLAYYGLDLFG